jgi:hypothetical protein
MANSYIKIKFQEDLLENAVLGIGVLSEGAFGFNNSYNIIYLWKNIRASNLQVTVATPTSIPGEATAINFLIAATLDLGNSYSISRIGNEVTISSTPIVFGGVAYNTSFSSPVFGFDVINGFVPIPNHPSIITETFNAVFDIFTIDSLVFAESSQPCTHVKVVLTTNVLAKKILSPFIQDSNTNNPIELELLRSGSFLVKLENENGTLVERSVLTPSILNEKDFEIKVNNSPNGASIFVKNEFTNGLIFEYSLNNIDWQQSNSFNGLQPQNYNLYIRDQLGCSVLKKFKVDEFNVQNPYFLISKSNSLRFANRTIYNQKYRTDESSLSCEADVKLPYKEIQQFEKLDRITTQFKSNYQENIVSVLKENGDTENVPVVKKTNNIGLRDSRDARMYDLQNSKTGVYFIGGNIYDFQTGVDTGEDYFLNGSLPEWAIIGNYFKIDFSWYVVENIVYDETKNAEVIVFDNIYTQPEKPIKISTIYNRFNYEVYEFDISMSSYLNQNFRIKIKNEDGFFDNLEHLSELIDVKESQPNTVEIIYKNDTNTDVFYSTGIEHKIRIPINRIDGTIEDISESYKTDTNALLLKAELYEIDTFTFEPITKEIMRKITQALSHRFVKINQVDYVKNNSIEVEGALEDTNLYVVKASMAKSNTVYSNQVGDGNNVSNESFTIEIPSLIKETEGYISY